MEWITPIFDRSQADIASVRSLINEIKEVGWGNLDEDSRNYFLGEIRGTFSKITYERVINNTQYLEQRLLKYGYNPKITHQKLTYAYSDIPTISQIKQSVSNLQKLLDCFYNVTGELPGDVTFLDIFKINAMEECLYDIGRYLTRTDGHVLRCGTVSCNQTVVGGLRWRIG